MWVMIGLGLVLVFAALMAVVMCMASAGNSESDECLDIEQHYDRDAE